MSIRLLFFAALCFAASPAAAQDAPPVHADSVFELAQVDPMPRPTNVDEFYAALQSAYPHALVGSGANGTVVTSFVIGADGAVRNARIVSSTVEGFDSATVQAVSRLRFTPGAVAGRAVAVRLELPVAWVAPETDPAAVAAAASDLADGVALELDAVEERPQVLNAAAMLRQMERLYPPLLRTARRSGSVQVSARVDERGRLSAPRVVSSTASEFDLPSLQAVSVLRFRPARVNGRPVPVRITIPLYWTVDSTPGPFVP